MSVYLSNPHALPDSEFDPGEFHHLVAGNAGRQLDPRRTPVSIKAIRREAGTFIVCIEDFEDKGALWEIPFESVAHYQFKRGAVRAEAKVVDEYREISRAMDRPLKIACEPDARAGTLVRLAAAGNEADRWLAAHSRFLSESGSLPAVEERRGDQRLFGDLARYMEAHNLQRIEEQFARQYVSGPHSGEIVRGHRIVLAELGLVAYEGKAPRDAAVFEGEWRREQRAEHIVARLAFLRALYRRLGLEQVMLCRGMSIEGPLEPPQNHTFVSASFSRAVAQSHFDSGAPSSTRVLLAQPVPVERIFMTYHETAAMNEKFLEAEAVLLWDSASLSF
jgi:hypothetical protein